MTHTHPLILASLVSALMLGGCSSDNDLNDLVNISPDDTSKPTLMLDADLSDMLTNQQNFAVSGTVEDDSGLSELKVSIESLTTGEKLPISISDDGQFSKVIPLESGENEFNIVVSDSAGNTTTYQASVYLDDVAPELTLQNFEENTISRTSQAVFKGKVTDDMDRSGVSLMLTLSPTDVAQTDPLNTQQITLNAAGEFEALLDLNAGDNEVVLTAKDEAGNTQIKTQHIYFGNTLSAANSHTGALVDNSLYAWGRNNYGQVGLGKTTKLRDDGSEHPIAPLLITQIPQDKQIVSISFNQNHSSLLTQDGKVYTWGSDKNGELGRGDSGRDDCGRNTQNCRLDIGQVSGLSDVIAISSGYGHRLALTKSGEVWAFGANNDNQLGVEGIENSSVPVQVIFPMHQNMGKIIQVTASASSSYALDDKGQVWAWGANDYANLGLGIDKFCDEYAEDPNDNVGCIKNSATPNLVVFPDDTKVIELAAGRDHVLALTEDNLVYGWGLNFSSQIGYFGGSLAYTDDEWAEYITTPKLLPWSEDKQVKHVYANGNTSYVLLDDDKVYPWGIFGETDASGDTNYLELHAPENMLPNLTNVVDMGVGALHQVAKREDGGIFSWGWSFEGSLGGGETTTNIWMYNVPIVVNIPD